MKREFIGTIKKYQRGYLTGWCFETNTNNYFGHVPNGIEALIDKNVQDGEKYKIIIEQL